MQLLFFAPLLVFAAGVNVVLYDPGGVPLPWEDTGIAADPTARLTITLQMKRTGQEALAKTVLDIATPGSPRFREWLSQEEVLTALKVSPQGMALISDWLRMSGIAFTTTPSVGQFHFTVTVREASQLFQTFFHHMKNSLTGQEWHRASVIHAPEEVAPHIATIFGVHGFPAPPRRPRVMESKANIQVGPKELNAVYNVSGRGRKSTKIRQAVGSFEGEFMNQNDLTTFFNNLVPNAQPGDELVYKYVHDTANGTGIEALLDIEYIMGMAPGILTEFWCWEAGASEFCADLLNWSTAILTDSNPPIVHSVSYGHQGEMHSRCTQAQLDAIDNNFMQLAGRGISLLFASGDDGSGYIHDGGHDGKLWPIWPGSSPWVTAVGGTSFTNETMKTQQATTQFGSGGGFHWWWDAGEWQKKAIATYLSTASGLPPETAYPKNGRGTADISFLGEGFKVYAGGRVVPVAGTSASSPSFAALISLINDDLDSRGKKQLGYLNPWLYANADVFTDITIGTNKISRGGSPMPMGYDCAPGWDPATGLGVPIFPKMKERAG
jgi:tripeptidyl-peptidase-1